jgi:hypothetical protein
LNKKWRGHTWLTDRCSRLLYTGLCGHYCSKTAPFCEIPVQFLLLLLAISIRTSKCTLFYFGKRKILWYSIKDDKVVRKKMTIWWLVWWFLHDKSLSSGYWLLVIGYWCTLYQHSLFLTVIYNRITSSLLLKQIITYLYQTVKTNATRGAEKALSLRNSPLPRCISGVRVVQSFVFLCSICSTSVCFVRLTFGHIIVLNYGFWLPLWYLQTCLYTGNR